MIDPSDRSRTRDEDRTFTYWWSRPSRLVLFLHVPVFLICGMLDESAYALYKQNSRFFAGTVFFYGLMALMAFAAASAYFEPKDARISAVDPVPVFMVDKVLNVLFVLVFCAYAIFMFPLVTKPQLLIDIAQGSPDAMYNLRNSLSRIPGVTSLVSLGSLLTALTILYRPLTGKDLPAIYWKLMLGVFVAGVLRAWLWSERLAVIELGLAGTIAMLAKGNPKHRHLGIKPLTFAPLLGLVALIVLFGLGEYFRSWQFYRNVFPGSYAEFILIRIAGYYATSLNNGAALVTLNDPFFFPTFTAEWFYRLPLWSVLGFSPVESVFDNDSWTLFLEAYLNPEFNNSSGIYVPFFDFGSIIGIAYWAAAGALSGYLFRGFAEGQLAGLLIYPVWFIGVVEMLRIFYWGDQRFFPVILAALIILRYFTRSGVARAVPAGGMLT